MSFIKDQGGGSVLEYGLVAALIAIAAITGLTDLNKGKSTKCPGNNLQSIKPTGMGSAGTPPG